jgi:protocatechuate 3,4-dioxygenase beta subunit
VFKSWLGLGAQRTEATNMFRRIAIVIATASLPAAYSWATDLPLTPAQAEGPYYPVSKPSDTDADLTRVGAGPPATGEVLVLDGKVLDRTGKPFQGARVEIWQTDHQGIYMHPGDERTGKRDMAFQFYGEARTDAAGVFRFRTVMPALYPGRPRHIHMKVTPPGGKTLTTQLYFKGDKGLNEDWIVRRLGKALERVTLAPAKAANGEETADVVIVLPR